MFAITPKGIGKKVGMRQVRPDFKLTSEEFIVEDWNRDMVLNEDGVSLRKGTVIELDPPPTVTDKRRAEYGTPEQQLEYIVENGIDSFIARNLAVKAKYPKG